METNPTSLSCLSERKGLYYISHHENEGGVSDSYGQVEQCEDPNDTCISGVGNTEYTTVSYKGCYGNLLKVLGDSISGNIPKSVTNCMKASVTGTFVTSYVNFCQCKGNFCNVDWTNSEPLTCVTGKTGLGLYSLLDMTPTSKVCSINEPCGKVIINDNGNIITAQGCASDVESLFTTNPAVSYPDNQCSEFGLLELASTEKNYDATLCSCTTQNCVMNN
uniref:DUF5857 domain-containing protein n=1 Tax=Rhabditophanes sp. KR3021 TaxID=114890 RepID=A0AC35UAJ3_9BILA